MKRMYKSEKVYSKYLLTVNGISMQFMTYGAIVGTINELQDPFYQLFIITNDRNQRVRYY